MHYFALLFIYEDSNNKILDTDGMSEQKHYY